MTDLEKKNPEMSQIKYQNPNLLSENDRIFFKDRANIYNIILNDIFFRWISFKTEVFIGL